MESFTKDLQGILSELNDADKQANEIIVGFQDRFDKLVTKFMETNSTPLKPTKKRPKGRVDKIDSFDDSFSSTNSSRSGATITATIDINDENNESQLLRPVRTGRAKQPANYKEPKLNTKLRRGDSLRATIKTERISTDAQVNDSKIAEVEPLRSVRVKKEKDERQSAAGKSTTVPAKAVAGNEPNKKLSKDSNDSLEIIAMDTNPPIELSDDENDGSKMPPPAFVPPAKAAKEKKPPAEKKIRATRSKQSKRTKIKQEPVSESEDEVVSTSTSTLQKQSNETISTEPEAKQVVKSASDKAIPSRAMNTTGESLYEDAVSEQNKAARDSVDNKALLSQQSDATFCTTTDEQAEQLSPRGTYIIPGSIAANGIDSTFMVPAAANNEAVVVETKLPKATNRTKQISLMTDDESDVESNSQTQKPKKKDPKELFNPCVSKPIKQRVEAFEKLQTPQKDTRTKARLPNTDNEKYTRSQNTVAKALLSSASDTTASRHLRTNSATRQNTAKQMLTKSQSVDEIRKKNQAVVDEKKKKQDDKLRKAQQLREAQDKEKHDKQRKLLLEKEQRAKEKLLVKQQEEQAKLQEQKRKEAEREQKRKDAMAKKAAADRREQEHYLKVLAEKKAMQEQLKMNKLRAEDQRKNNAYDFDQLASGDSTDDETKPSVKRPPPPTWSMSQHRHPYVSAQTRVTTKVVDKFFSVAPHNVDLREIFPTIDERHLRRNSSAVWNSPPRYSQLPKY